MKYEQYLIFCPQMLRSHISAIVLLAAVTGSFVMDHQEYELTVDKRSEMHFCGSSLTDALEMMCHSGVGKRSGTG